MLLEIDDWRSVGDLQYRFNKCFSNLNLLIYDAQDPRSFDRPISAGTTLELVRKVHDQGVLSIKSWFTKNEVENLLRERFGVVARVVPAIEGLSFPQKDCGKFTLNDLNQTVGEWEKRFRPKVEKTDELIESL